MARQAGQGWNDPGRHYPLNDLEVFVNRHWWLVWSVLALGLAVGVLAVVKGVSA